jgi:glycosyltransferase involved in cell wall biosynthesis
MIELPINPTGSNTFEELKTFRFLLKLYRKDRPDIVHHVGIKNILWGGLAARLTRIKGVVNAVSGLGVLFSGEHFGLMTRCVMMVMRFSSNRENVKQIFQNSEDRELFVKHGIAKDEQCEFIKGSGVDLTKFVYTPEPDTQPIKVILTARMVKEKGICTLIEAAEILRSEGLPRHARVAERHTGTGLTASERTKQGLPLPPRDFTPESIEEQIVCYADKFFSKTKLTTEKTLEQAIRSLSRFGEEGVKRFTSWAEKFE